MPAAAIATTATMAIGSPTKGTKNPIAMARIARAAGANDVAAGLKSLIDVTELSNVTKKGGGASSVPIALTLRCPHFGGHNCLPSPSFADYRENMSDSNEDEVLTPATTATGAGTSMGEPGTTEADVTDGADQKLPKIEGDDSES
jgi:hypothetical protein